MKSRGSCIPVNPTVVFFSALLMLLVVLAAGCTSQKPSAATNSDVKPQQLATGPADLHILLEGPLAICSAGDKIKIYLPEVEHHFITGFTADLSDGWLCPKGQHSSGPATGKYELKVGKNNGGMMKAVENGIEVDQPNHGGCPAVLQDGDVEITAVKPDFLVRLAPISASFTDDNDVKSYATKLMLVYESTDLAQVGFAGDACVEYGHPSNSTQRPKFVQVKPSQPVRLLLGRSPSEIDQSLDHKHAREAYKNVADRLGSQREIKTIGLSARELSPLSTHDPVIIAGPHNDCRAPQTIYQ